VLSVIFKGDLTASGLRLLSKHWIVTTVIIKALNCH